MRKLHPASVAVRSVSRSVNTGLLFFVVGIVASPGSAGANLLGVGGMVLVGILVGIVYEFAYYERFRYELTADTFDVTSGVLARRDREVPLRRIQNVDVRQNVLVRALGLAAVHVETAGGGQTEVTLQYVGEGEARRLRRRLLNGSVDADELDSDADSAADRVDIGDEEELLFAMQPRELAVLSSFTIDPGASLLGGIALSFASGFDPGTLIPFGLLEDLPGTGLFALAWAVLLFLLAAWIVSAALTFNRYYGFRLTRVDDELYYERGLLQRYSGTIPLDKVQTLTIAESVPFRWFGYGSLAVETAGYAPGQAGARGTESAIPLAGRDRVLALARSIEPFGDLDFERPPRRARERYAVRYLVVVAIVVAAGYLVSTVTSLGGYWYALALLTVVVPIAAHLKWSSRGYRFDDRLLLTRTGFWRRTTKVVPYYRVQAVVHTQTVFQRRRRLANVTADTASSASFFGRAGTAYDVDADHGLEMQAHIETRLQERLRARDRDRSSGNWFRTVSGDDEDTSSTESS
ncbi:PH domain-containing protein [Halosolutus halophilus]|uniref:PH domain-containing protein n=1 Tax=Halosolutus halophilus TaxID=1552990 RepID=UPI0022351AC1|nr:PH domain-containing protein [Halosolutus halophilus]